MAAEPPPGIVGAGGGGVAGGAGVAGGTQGLPCRQSTGALGTGSVAAVNAVIAINVHVTATTNVFVLMI